MNKPKNPNIDPMPLVGPNISASTPVPEKPEVAKNVDSQVPPPTPPVPEPPKTNKFLIIGVAVLVLLVLATGGYFAYQNYFVKKTPVSTESSPTPTADPTTNWKTYEFKKMGFSISLPPNWYTHEETLGPAGTFYETCISYPVNNPSCQAASVEGLVANIHLGVNTKPQTKTLDIYITDLLNSPRMDLKKDSEIKVAGERAIILKDDAGTTTRVILLHKNIPYDLQLGTEDLGLVDIFYQILSTFKFLEESSTNPIVTSPSANAKITSPLTITGTVPAGWMFEGVFPVKLVDSNKNLIIQGQGKEKVAGSWQSGNPVEFTATLTFTTTAKSGFIILENDNPSGDPAKAKTFEVPVTF